MIVMLNDAQKSVDVGIGKGFKPLFVTDTFNGSENFMASYTVFKLLGEAMVQFTERLLKTSATKTFKGLRTAINPSKGIETAKTSKNEVPEN